MTTDTDPAPMPAAEMIAKTVVRIARLGEQDQFGWFGTRSFGAAGRVVLGQRLPRTWRMAAVELDIASAMNRHNEILDRRNAVHLFSDNWPVRRWATAWVSEQKTATPPDIFFENLESATQEEVTSLLQESAAKLPPVSGQAVRMGSISATEFTAPELLLPAVNALAATYLQLGDRFVVPYMEIE